MASKGFYCTACGKLVEAFCSPCPGCGAFNSLSPGAPRDGGWVRAVGTPQLLGDVKRKDVDKLETGTRELDRVLAGGFAFEGAYSLSGEPGAGKSTLARQVLMDVCNMEMLPKEDGTKDDPYVVLYVAGEETAGQIAQGADRLGKSAPRFWVVNETDALKIEKLVIDKDPDVVVIDSIQTMTIGEAAAGSVVAVKEAAAFLVGMCKARGAILILICHVTKDGSLAGPKTFEHLVDGCLRFEEEPPFRVLRMSKHRFGPTTEVGLFKMGPTGLSSIENPSELLLENHIEGVSGSVIGAMAEGKVGDSSRAMLVELQTLLCGKSDKGLSISATGIVKPRCEQIAAVLAKRVGVQLLGDLYVSIAGGIDSEDVGLDLPLALSIISSHFDKCMPEAFCAFGEIGLLGEVRPPRSIEARLKTAEVMGMTTIMGPPLPEGIATPPKGYVTCVTIQDALAALGWGLGSKSGRKKRTHVPST